MTIQPNMLPDRTFRESYDLKKKQLKHFYSKLWAGIPKWVPQLVASSWLVTLQLWNPLVYKSILVCAILILNFSQLFSFVAETCLSAIMDERISKRIYSVVVPVTVFLLRPISIANMTVDPNYAGLARLEDSCVVWVR